MKIKKLVNGYQVVIMIQKIFKINNNRIDDIWQYEVKIWI